MSGTRKFCTEFCSACPVGHGACALRLCSCQSPLTGVLCSCHSSCCCFVSCVGSTSHSPALQDSRGGGVCPVPPPCGAEVTPLSSSQHTHISTALPQAAGLPGQLTWCVWGGGGWAPLPLPLPRSCGSQPGAVVVFLVSTR